MNAPYVLTSTSILGETVDPFIGRVAKINQLVA